MFGYEEGDLITIQDEAGESFELEVVGFFDFNGKDYGVFVPSNIDEMDPSDPDYGLIFMRVHEEKDEVYFDQLDSDEELETVYEFYEQILEAEEDEEDGE